MQQHLRNACTWSAWRRRAEEPARFSSIERPRTAVGLRRVTYILKFRVRDCKVLTSGLRVGGTIDPQYKYTHPHV